MSRELEKVKEDEIDLIDLLRVIVVNKKTILIVWIITLIMGLFLGLSMKKNKRVEGIRNYQIKDMEYMSETKEINLEVNSMTSEKDGVVNFKVNPFVFFEDKIFLSEISEIISKREGINLLDMSEENRNSYVKKIFLIDTKQDSNDFLNYTVKISGTSMNEVIELETKYFERLQIFLKNNYINILNKNIKPEKTYMLNIEKELREVQNKIEQLLNKSKGKYSVEDLKMLHPIVFSKEEALYEIYRSNYKNQKIIENSLTKLNDLIVYQSTLNKVEDKMSLKLIFIISNVLGIFLGIFIVFVKEFIKGINWKELKQLSK